MEFVVEFVKGFVMEFIIGFVMEFCYGVYGVMFDMGFVMELVWIRWSLLC